MLSKLRLDGAIKFSSYNDECVRCGVERNTPHIMMDCILGSERRSKLNEKLINAFEGYEYLTKTQKMTYMLNLSHNDEEIRQEICKYIKKCVCPTLYCLNLYLVIDTMFHVPCIYYNQY